MAPQIRRYDHFRSYQPERDETRQLDGSWQPEMAACVDVLTRLTPQALKERYDRLLRTSRDAGLHFASEEELGSSTREWELDLLPRIIPRAEWRVIERGVTQRLRALNALVADIHGPQLILQKGVLPVRTVLTHPSYHPELQGISLPGQHWITIAAVDLVKMADGHWKILETNCATPFGIAHAMQNRTLLAQSFPEYFEQMEVEPVSSFLARMAEVFRQAAPTNTGRPLTVILTRGGGWRAQIEEGYLARGTGALLARPEDLLVRHSRVYLKTVQGLEPVDVIYRRIETSSIDPVAFGPSPFQGVPGLLHCLRRGTVSILNGPGSGVADNRALLRYGDDLLRFYLEENPILETVPTFLGEDAQQLAWMQTHRRKLVLKPVVDRSTLRKYYPDLMPKGTPEEIDEVLTQHPELVVAQPYLSPTKAPRYLDGQFQPRSVFLRVFVILEPHRAYVMPGGLTRQSIEPHLPNRFTIMTEGMKDTWVPEEPERVRRGRPPRTALEAILAPGELPLSSRTAEHIYWMGRYLERTECTAHRLTILEQVRWEELTGWDQQVFRPLWRAVLAASDVTVKSVRPPKAFARWAQKLYFDAREHGSVRSCLNSVMWNASCIREALAPETWVELQPLPQLLDSPPIRKEQSTVGTFDLGQSIQRRAALINGVMERFQRHDEGWRFYKIGQYLERAWTTATFLEHALPFAVKDQLRHLADDSGLLAILRVTGSLDSFLREYRARPYVDRVARLLWQSPGTPNSTGSCLLEIRRQVLAIQEKTGSDKHRQFLEYLQTVQTHLQELPIPQLFPVRDLWQTDRHAPAIEEAMANSYQQVRREARSIREMIERLHDLLEDLFFSHQENVTGYQMEISFARKRPR